MARRALSLNKHLKHHITRQGFRPYLRMMNIRRSSAEPHNREGWQHP